MTMNEFDSKAKEWDNNPVHNERSEAIAKKMIEMVNIKPEMKALEYGAGTGILSFLLSEHFSEITLMDNSQEMIKMIRKKIADKNKTNLKPLQFNLENDDFKTGSFDFIFTQMVLHHITNTRRLIEKLYGILNKDGILAIADLYPEDGSFHGEGFSGHNGFNTEELRAQLENTGFSNVTTEQCYIIKKESSKDVRAYPVFLMIGRK